MSRSSTTDGCSANGPEPASATWTPPAGANEPFFVVRYIRALMESNAVSVLGCEVLALCVSVAVMLDKLTRFSRPIDLWNSQAQQLIGVGSSRRDTLARVRQKAVDSGWLWYAPQGTRRPGLYAVLIPGLNAHGACNQPEAKSELHAPGAPNPDPISAGLHAPGASNSPSISAGLHAPGASNSPSISAGLHAPGACPPYLTQEILTPTTTPLPPKDNSVVVVVENLGAEKKDVQPRQPTRDDAGDRLRAAQVSRWSAALNAAIDNGCSPDHIIRLADFAAERGFGPGAIYDRVLNAHPSTPVESGWPPPVAAPKTAAPASGTARLPKANQRSCDELEKRIGPLFDSMSVDEQDALAYRKWSPSGRENGDILRYRSLGAGTDSPEIRIPLLALLQQELHQRGELGAIAAGAAFNAPSTDAVSHRRPECQATEFWNHVGGGRYCRICYPPTDAKAVKPPEAMRA